jgi:hypothetical protein
MQERKHGHAWVESEGSTVRPQADFFAAKVGEVAGDWAPVGLSTMMHALDPMEFSLGRHVQEFLLSGGEALPSP